MNKALKIVKIGNSAGVILPKEVLARLGTEPGASIGVTDTKDGIELRPLDEEFERQMEVARTVMAERQRALRELAK